MAKKINKKVAIIGSIVFAAIALFVIVVLLYKLQGPEKFIADGDRILKEAENIQDSDEKIKKYDEAVQNYMKAKNRAKLDSQKIQLLEKVAEVYYQVPDWRKVLGCLEQIVRLDPKNVYARFGKLKYFYVVANSGANQIWKNVDEQVTDFISSVNNDYLSEDIKQFDKYPIEDKSPVSKLGAFLYYARGKSRLQRVITRDANDVEQLLADSTADLKKIQDFEPNNIDSYILLSEAIAAKESIEISKGISNTREQTIKEAQSLLEKAIETAKNDSRPAVGLLNLKLQGLQAKDLQTYEKFEQEYIDITNRYSTDPYAYRGLSEYYLMLGYKYLNKAINAMDKAIELDEQNISYYYTKASLYFQMLDVTKDRQYLDKTSEVLETALKFPDAIISDKFEPRYIIKRINKISLKTLQAFCYIEQVLNPVDSDSKTKKDQWLSKAEAVVYDICQLFDSGQDPQVVKWQGLLELAKGNTDSAVIKLYSVYGQLRTADTRQAGAYKTDPQVSYALGMCFKNTTDSGASVEFLAAAIRSGIQRIKPTALLDCAEILFMHKDINNSLSLVNTFENNYIVTKRTNILRMRILVDDRQYEEAEALLKKLEWPADDPNSIKLNLELIRNKLAWSVAQKQKISEPNLIQAEQAQTADDKKTQQFVDEEIKAGVSQLKDLVIKLMSEEPEMVNQYDTTFVFNNLILQNDVEQAQKFIAKCTEVYPDNPTYKLYESMAKEKDPRNITAERLHEIKENVFADLPDKVVSSQQLAFLYMAKNEPNKAIEKFEKVLSLTSASDTGEKKNARFIAIQTVFDLALMKKDWTLAEDLLAKMREENIDGCGGTYLAAKLYFTKGDSEQAMQNINETLAAKPIFSSAYLLRGTINATLNKEADAIIDFRKAMAFNPLDPKTARLLANLLYNRDIKLGNNITAEQSAETETALNKALVLNFNDPFVKSMYAEYISKKAPDKGLAMRQLLLKQLPTLENCYLLVKMALNMAEKETDESKKKLLYGTAEDAINTALKIAPKDDAVINLYAQFCQITGQPEKAQKLLADANNPYLMSINYVRTGQLDKAELMLLDMYKQDSKNPETIKGLITISESKRNQQDLKKYTEELIEVQDTSDNRINQVRAYLLLGMIKDAETKLAEIKQKYPQDSQSVVIEAFIKMDKGQTDESLELINSVIDKNPENPIALKLRGNLSIIAAKYTEAISDLEKGRQLSKDPQIKFLLAKAYYRNNEIGKAITVLANTIEDPESPMEAWRFLEQLYIQENNLDELSVFYDKAVKTYSNSAQWLGKAGQFFATQKNYPKAAPLFEKAWEIGQKTNDTGADSAFYNYLKILFVMGKTNEMLEEASKHLDSNYAPVAYIGMAEAKLKNGDQAAAADYANKAVEKSESNQNLNSWVLSKVYELLGPEQAEKICNQLLQKRPDSFAPNYAIFGLATIKRDYNKALEYIDKCINISGPNNPQYLQLFMNKTYTLDRLYDKTSDKKYLAQAIKEYESLIQKMPNNKNVLNNLAYLMATNDEQLDKALEYAQQAYAISSDDPGILDTYAFVLFKNNQFAEAEKIIQSTIQLYEKNQAFASADVYEHLGMIKEKLEKNNEAIEAYRTAMDLYGKSKSQKDVDRLKEQIDKLSNK